jgi:hypothetical protein
MKRAMPFQLLVVLIVFLFACKKKDSNAGGTPTTPGLNDLSKLENFNFILGTHAISKSYQFTAENKMVEQAKKVREMGSNILKISMGPNSTDIYGITEVTKSTRVLDLFTKNLPYRTAFDMDFKYIFIWVHTLAGIDWKNGINASQEQILYDEMYNFALHLLNRYNNTGKTFMIGNWEGDWILLPSYDRTQTPPAHFITNMIKWYQIRQKAIDDAKKATTSTNVFMCHYAEVNLALKGMQGQPCVSESVLPNVDVDLISYSSYEAIKDKTYAQKKTELTNVFNYLESKLKPRTPALPFSRRVFIGEYGYQANASNSASMQKQVIDTKDIMKISFELNLPFSLHWQMYNNEYEANGTSKQMSLINESGTKMPLYFTHQNFYKKMNNYLITYKADNNNTLPSTEDFRKKALEVLNTL